jgi:homoserine dehydrogenase
MKLSVVHQQTVEALPTGIPVGEAEPLLVLKFGSSILQTIDDLPAVAGEIYRQRRKGHRIIAVVSALAGETDRLFREAARLCAGTNCSGVGELVSLGEERTAALLKIACDRIGLTAAICRAEEIGLHTEGSDVDAEFRSLTPFALVRKLEATGVVIVPGFVGVGEQGQRTLLGRGGSDFTAAILGGELEAKTVRLYKDVDGVFENDPALVPSARKFDDISYKDALLLARPLVHAKAIDFAAARHLPIEVETIGSSRPTRIGSWCSSACTAPSPRPIRVALAGYGVVGQALATRLAHDSRFEIKTILVRDPGRKREVAPPVRLTNDVAEFARVEADVLVELLSCERTGAALCCDRLRRGVPVATASKRLVSEHFTALEASASVSGAPFLYSAAVGGSAPLLEAVDRAAAAGEIKKVRGIFNGTINFVLERLSQGARLDEALDLARENGFAEENCEADVSGADAAAKLKIIARRAFGVSPASVNVAAERLDKKLASRIRASGERWVQLSQVYRSGNRIEAGVGFCPASAEGLQALADEWNEGLIELVDGRQFGVRGRGAGGAATAEAVLADLYDLLDRARPIDADAEGFNVTGETKRGHSRGLA